MLRQVEVIGARGRAWPIRDGKDQIRLLKNATTARSAPVVPSQQESTTLPHRSSSPNKRHIRDPYAAESLTELLSPSKEIAEIESRAESHKPAAAASGKRYTKDPYGAGSLNEILSPSKKAPAPVAPFAPATGRPATRNFSDIFVRDDNIPDSPSKPQRRAPRVPEEDETTGLGPVDEDRHFYKTAPGKYNHFEIGGDNSEREVKAEPKQATSHASHWDFDDFATPVKGSRPTRGEEARQFGVGDDEKNENSGTAKLNVIKPRRDADRHFEMTDEESDEDGRIISSFGGRGQRLYENRLFDDVDGPQLSEREKKNEPLSTTGNAANRMKNFGSQFEIMDDSPAPKGNATPTVKHDKAVKMMESHWDNYDESPEPKRTATAQRNPAHHNQPSWQMGDE